MHWAPATAGRVSLGAWAQIQLFSSPAQSIPQGGVGVTGQVAWNKVSNWRRALIGRRGLAAKRILWKASFSPGCFPGSGTLSARFSASCL